MLPDKIYEDTLYQIGALSAFTTAAGLPLHQVSPHGALDPIVSNDAESARAFIRAIKDFNADLIVIAGRETLLYKECEAADVSVASVAYPDLKYDDQGNWIMPSKTKELADPAEVAKRALSIVKEQRLKTVVETYLETGEAAVLCFHGDTPNAVDILRKVHKTFQQNGVVIKAV